MRILVAEDDAPFADFLRQRLVQEQFAVQLASDGTEAQRLATNQAFDLVILDLNLPGAAGLDVLRNIRSRKPDLPVMVVTTSSMVEERVLMRHAGQPVTRTAIVEQVWKLNFDTMTNVVDVYINYLRRKMDTGYERALIRTVRGVGYQIGGNGAAG
jgi:DNA-binding response OmpR family regulator